MTIVVYRDGVMAADTASVLDGVLHPWTRKLARAPDGTLYGVSGHIAESHEFLSWVDGGCVGSHPEIDRDKDGDSVYRVLVASPDGAISEITTHGVDRYLPEVPYAVIGCGQGVALGTLYVGGTAVQAVEACLLHSEGCGGRSVIISHRTP